MAKKKSSSDKDNELQQLVNRYEALKAENQSFYMDADQVIELVEWYELDGNLDSAFEVLDYGMKLHPDHVGLLVAKAYLYIDQNDITKAKAVARQLKDDFSVEGIMLRSEILLLDGKLKDAELLLNNLRDANDAETYIDIACLYGDMGHTDLGIHWLKRAINLAPDHEDILLVSAEYCYTNGEYDKAIQYYNTLLDKEPYSYTYWMGLGKVYFTIKNYSKAIEASDFALISDPDAGEAYLLKAHSLFHLENPEAAVREYKLVLEKSSLAPEFIYAYIGICYTAMEDWHNASYYYEKALYTNDDLDQSLKVDVYNNLSFSLYKSGDFQKARKICRIIQKLYPDYIDSYLLEGRMYFDEGQLQLAETSWNFILNKYPADSYTWTQIGEHCLEMGDLRQAKKALEKVIELDPENSSAHALLTIVYIRLKDWKNLLMIQKHFDMPIGMDIKSYIKKYYNDNSDKIDQEILDALNELDTD